MEVYFLGFLALQFIAFTIYYIDKYKAVKNYRRVSEKNLLLVTLIAPLGSILAIYIIRHKVKKLSYMLIAWFLVLVSLYLHYEVVISLDNSLLR